MDYSIYNPQTLPNGAVVIRDLEQGTQDWHAVRLGILTASEFGVLFVNGKRKDNLGAAAVTAAYRVAGEIFRLQAGYDAIPEAWSNVYTERGHAMEKELRDEYAFINGHEVQEVGFVLWEEKRCGGSPDDLVNDNGLAEYKSHKPEILIPMLLDPAFPSTHRGQCVGNLYTSGEDREWIDLLAGFEGMPRLERRLTRDDAKEDLAVLDTKLLAFNELVDDTLEQLRKGNTPAPVAMAAE